MVAILDKREGKAVHAILKELARTYPQVSEKWDSKGCSS